MNSNMVFQRELYGCLRKYKNNIAISSTAQCFTYAQVDQYSDRILYKLREKNIEKNAQVVCLLESKIDIILAMTACLKGGYIFVPFDHTYPLQRLKRMFDSIDSYIILTDKSDYNISEQIAAQKEVTLLTLGDDFYNQEDVPASEFFEEDYQSDDPIYIFYTSGSTGTPKAIVGKNCGLLHFIQWEIETFHLDESSRISQLTTPCHDPILRDVYSAFFSGGTTCIPENKEVLLDMNQLSSWIDEEKLTLIHCTPSIFQALNEADLKQHAFENLKYILMAGEQISIHALEKWFDRYGDRITCVNLYGSTETTMVKAYYVIQKEDVRRSNIPIGKTMKGAKFILLDEDMKITPKGQIGEIYIRTPYGSLGYYNKEYNRTSFVRNPFGKDENDLLYKTGDLCKQLEDGNYEFHGRIDRQVKIRGIRVELDEIERNLESHDAIVESAVILKKKSEIDSSPELIAFYVALHTMESNLLREFLSNKMNDNIIPSTYIQIESLPRLKNGKINYKELEQLEVKKTETLVGPHNETEEKLLEIWKDILGKNEIGVNQNFLQIGGHSLLIMTMITRINREFEVEISLGEIFAGATIEKIAALLQDKQNTGRMMKMQTAKEKAHYALSNAQLRMYALWERSPESILYNMPAAYWIEGKLDFNKLEAAFQETVRRHEILRTKFEMIDGEVVQTILNELQFHMESANVAREEVDEYIKNFIRPFHLQNPPLVRAALLTVGESSVFLVDFYHIIGDATSMEILLKEIIQVYGGFQLHAVEYQYKDYSEWMKDYVESAEYQEQKDYWHHLYKQVPPTLNLPTDYPRTDKITNRGKTLHVDLAYELSKKIHEYSSNQMVTPNIVMLSAFLTLLYRYTKQSDLVVGTVVAGRTHMEEEEIVGPFINTLALRNKVTADMTFQELIHNVRTSFVSSYQNQSYAFDDLVTQLNMTSDYGRNPLFDIVYDYQNEEKHEIQMNGITFQPMNLETDCAKFDFCIHITEFNNNYSIGVEYRSDLFKQETILRMMNQYTKLLDTAMNEPKKQIGYLDMLTCKEKAIMEQNVAKLENVQDFSTIDARFEQMVALYKENTAVEYENTEGEIKSFTYQELDVKANQFANYLRSLNVSEGDIVGVMMNDISKAVIAILGILKVGAIYLPVGIGYYPDQFIIDIITDSHMRTFVIDNRKEASIAGLIDHITSQMIAPQIIEFEQVEDQLNLYGIERVRGTHTQNSKAYVIYTSGTTGKPKGVTIYHKGITNLVQYVKESLEITSVSRVLQFSSLSFDMSVWEIFITILNGATLCIFDRRKEIGTLGQFIASHNITLATLTPSVLRVISADGLNDLKTIVSAGESCTKDILETWNHNRKFVNAYGPTETTICATLRVVNDQNPNIIGRSVTNMSCYILDENMQRCPFGVPGELYIGGIGIAAGYLNNEELTNQKFVLVDEIGEGRLYRSGDLAKWTVEGEIEILGRIDEQIKIRGFRIETGFIEAKICEVGNVLNASVVKSETEELFVFYTAQSVVDKLLIKEHLKDQIPSYMMPSYIVQVDGIPLTPGGKVDKKKLLELCAIYKENDEVAATELGSKPRNETESKLYAIWSEILRKENLTIDDNFFENGGHSLNAIQVVSKAKEMGIQLTAEDLFKYKTIRSLSDMKAI